MHWRNSFTDNQVTSWVGRTSMSEITAILAVRLLIIIIITTDQALVVVVEITLKYEQYRKSVDENKANKIHPCFFKIENSCCLWINQLRKLKQWDSFFLISFQIYPDCWSQKYTAFCHYIKRKHIIFAILYNTLDQDSLLRKKNKTIRDISFSELTLLSESCTADFFQLGN